MIRHIRNSQFVIRNWRKARQGFTLMEVNLAMFVMAVGTLGLVSLYSFGYRENQQSKDDVKAAATKKFQDINNAKELIFKARGMK